MSAPESLDLTAAATELLELVEALDGTYNIQWVGIAVWKALTGLDSDDEALAYAAQVAAAALPVTAHVPPM